jgi:hypothetical protein
MSSLVIRKEALEFEKLCEICNHEITARKMCYRPNSVFLCGLCNIWMCRGCIENIPAHHIKNNRLCCFKCLKKHHKWCRTCKSLKDFNV